MINTKTFLNYFLLLIWMGVIFYLSNQPDLKSGLESWLDFVLRKAAHITEYGILAFLAWRAFRGREERISGVLGNRVSKRPLALVIAIIFAFIFSISDEYHQSFVHGRVGSPVDVLIDSAGIAIAALTIYRK